MRSPQGQESLFSNDDSSSRRERTHQKVCISKELLVNWQTRIHDYQSRLFSGGPNIHHQGTLFQASENLASDNFQPLELSPLPLSFWKWPKTSNQGSAIYVVMDRIKIPNSYILLYIGETIAAERRWKGEHDCKAYLDAYCEALSTAGIQSQLSIRFWSDVPSNTQARRKLELELISKWLPPFNKETRARWSTPFTAKIN